MKVFVPIIAVSALLASTVSGWSAESRTATGSLKVTITINTECKVNPDGGTTLDFGTYGVVDKDIDQKGSISVQCTKDTPYSIGLNAGANPSTANDVNTRRMKGPGANDYVGYQLYSDDGRKTVWGNAEKKDTVGSKIGDGTAQPYQVHGRVSKSAAVVAAGTYTDTVTVTVTF